MARQSKSLQAGLVAAVLLAAPAVAFAAPGMINSSVNLRAGPSVEFPVVNRLPGGAPVEVHGCIRQDLWCDISWGGERGWVAAQYLDYLYDGRYVDLPSYVVDVPIASFVLTSYWSSYYFGRPWYRRHAWWNRHWNTQPHVASQTPAAQPVATPAQAGRGTTPATIAPAVARGQGMGAQAMQPPTGGMVPAAGGQNRVPAARPPMISRAAGQATAMRSGGVPMAARAQFGASRGGLAGLPHAAMCGTPQAGGAMHNGGGGSRDNGGGRRRH
jgi:uncharacterized protein YraI